MYGVGVRDCSFFSVLIIFLLSVLWFDVLPSGENLFKFQSVIVVTSWNACYEFLLEKKLLYCECLLRLKLDVIILNLEDMTPTPRLGKFTLRHTLMPYILVVGLKKKFTNLSNKDIRLTLLLLKEMHIIILGLRRFTCVAVR
jgi:hypothetical protein